MNSNLAGNWLITGSLPSPSAMATSVNLAMTFDVIGSNVVAGGFMNVPCGNVRSSGQFGAIATGTIAPDGSFTAQLPNGGSATPAMSVSIQGSAPKDVSGTWTGNYTVAMNLMACSSGTLSGTFTATPIQPVTGNYAGTRTFTVQGTSGLSTPVPVAVQMNLQQGAQVGQPGFYSSSVLTGNIQVQGLSCFSTGTISSTTVSGVEGNAVVATFDMNDGSTVVITGSLEDVGATRISTEVMEVKGGSCGSMLSLGTAEFQRQ